MEAMWLMIAVIGGIGCGIPIVAIWTKHRKDLAVMEIEAKAQIAAENTAQFATQNREIMERLQVLERIVTDKGYDVATQIEALRELQSVSGKNEGTGVPLKLNQETSA